MGALERFESIRLGQNWKRGRIRAFLAAEDGSAVLFGRADSYALYPTFDVFRGHPRPRVDGIKPNALARALTSH